MTDKDFRKLLNDITKELQKRIDAGHHEQNNQIACLLARMDTLERTYTYWGSPSAYGIRKAIDQHKNMIKCLEAQLEELLSRKEKEAH